PTCAPPAPWPSLWSVPACSTRRSPFASTACATAPPCPPGATPPCTERRPGAGTPTGRAVSPASRLVAIVPRRERLSACSVPPAPDRHARPSPRRLEAARLRRRRRRAARPAAVGELVEGDVPVGLAVGGVGGTAGVLDVHQVALLREVVEGLGPVRAEVDAAVRDVLRSLRPHRPRRGVDEEAVGGDRGVPVDVLVVAVGRVAR